MPYTAAKCPNCGASIEVDSDAKFSRCEFCGSTMEPQKAIAKLQLEVSGKVEVPGISTVGNDLKLGTQCLEAKDWQAAYKVFCIAIDKQADCFDAWYGCLASMTRNFTVFDNKWASFEGAKGLRSVMRNCCAYTRPEIRQSLLISIEDFINKWIKEYSALDSSLKYWKTLSISVILIGILVFVSMIYIALNGGFQSSGFYIFTIVIAIVITFTLDRKQNIKAKLQSRYDRDFETQVNSLQSEIRKYKFNNPD